MDIERIAVEVGPTVPGGTTNAYILGRDPACLVDPADQSAALDRAVENRAVEHVFLTHAHPDHVDGLAAYAEGRHVWARRGMAATLEQATGVSPGREFRTGESLSLGATTLEILDAPGHTPHHVAFDFGGVVACGDTAIEHGSIVVASPEGDMRAYLSTLRRLWARHPDRLLPGHGPLIDDPRATLGRLIDHRLERETRVKAAVEAGADTPAVICDHAYDKDLTGVRAMAEATVVAHLEKLAVEGAIEWDGHRAIPD